VLLERDVPDYSKVSFFFYAEVVSSLSTVQRVLAQTHRASSFPLTDRVAGEATFKGRTDEEMCAT